MRSDAPQISSGRRIILILIVISFTLDSFAQISRFRPIDLTGSMYQVSGKKLIIPAVLIAYGFAQFTIDPILDRNLKVRSEITSRVTTPFKIDNWLTDVVAGAGFGIISTKLAYWAFPQIKKQIFKDIQFSFSLNPALAPRYGPAR